MVYTDLFLYKTAPADVMNGRLIKRPQDDNQLQKGTVFLNISDALFSSERRSRVFSVSVV
jgi:hypothetical protein